MSEIFYPYGTQYYRAPTPLPDEWELDLQTIKSAGYTHIQLRPQWRWHEAVRHRYQFDDIARLFELAEDNDLKVILKPMLETAPDWAFQELGGTRIGFNGIPLTPFAHGAYYVGGWWPCFENARVRNAALEFVKALTTRFCDQSSLWLYDAWNEPRARPVESCQCDSCQVSYREWLRRKFGTIDDLNDFYGKRWTSFESVMPPVSGDDYVEMMLWRDWAAEAVAGHVTAVIDQIREVDPVRQILFHRGTVDVVTDIIWDAGDDIRNAQAGCDWYGYSCAVEFHPRNPQDQALVALQANWMRRVDTKNWCHEFYPRTGNWERGPEIKHLKQQTLISIASGAKGFTWWQYRAERVGNETSGFGLVEVGGQSSVYSEYAEFLAGFLKEHGATIATSRTPKCPVALVYDRSSDMVSRMTIFGSYFTRLPESNKVSPYKSAFGGAHCLHWLHNVECDILLPGDDLSGYRFLHITASEMVSPQMASWLEGFVKAGGFLFVEYPFACRDENTWVSRIRPNSGLEQLLGCIEAGRVRVDGRADDRVIWPGVAEIEAVDVRCDLNPTTGTVLASWADGKPAVIQHTVGRGTVLVSGVNISRSSIRGTSPQALAAFQHILELAEVQPLLAPEYRGKLIMQRRILSEGHVVFLYNLTDEAIVLPDWVDADAKSWLGSLEHLANSRLAIPPRETWIGLLAKKAASESLRSH